MPAIYNGTGEAIADEAVAITTPVTIGGSPYFEGRLAQWHAPNVYGITDPDFGFWVGAAKTGVRFQINELSDAAVPADSDPGTGSPPDLTLDPASGVVRSTISQTLFATYLGLGDHVQAQASAGGGDSIVLVDLDGLLFPGSIQDWSAETTPQEYRFTEYQIIAAQAGGMAPTGSPAALELRDFVTPGPVGASRAMAMAAGVRYTGWVALASALVIPAGGLLVVHGDGNGAQNLKIKLRHQPL